MNQQLRNLQESIQLAIYAEDVTAGQIIEVVRETLKMEEDSARTQMCKAQDVLLKLDSNRPLGVFDGLRMSSDTIMDGGAGSDTICFGAANTVSPYFGAAGTDTISFK